MSFLLVALVFLDMLLFHSQIMMFKKTVNKKALFNKKKKKKEYNASIYIKTPNRIALCTLRQFMLFD